MLMLDGSHLGKTWLAFW